MESYAYDLKLVLHHDVCIVRLSRNTLKKKGTHLDIELVHVIEEILNGIFGSTSVQQHEFDIARRQER